MKIPKQILGLSINIPHCIDGLLYKNDLAFSIFFIFFVVIYLSKKAIHSYQLSIK
jgi:hypothetical protein